MSETPKKLVVDHLFADDKEGAKKFWEKVKDGDKDEVTMPPKDLFDGEGEAGSGEEVGDLAGELEV